MRNSKYWKEYLQLEAHPSGAGFFKTLYRSDELIKNEYLHRRFNGDRIFCSSIYYLLEAGQLSPLHKVKSDEQFSHIDGDSMKIYVFEEDSKSFSTHIIGKEEGTKPYVMIPKGAWFAYELINYSDYVLLTCTLSPGFDPSDFTFSLEEDRIRLIELFPQQMEIINYLTLNNSLQIKVVADNF